LRCDALPAAPACLAQRPIGGCSLTQGYARFARSPWAIHILPLRGNDVFAKLNLGSEARDPLSKNLAGIQGILRAGAMAKHPTRPPAERNL